MIEQIIPKKLKKGDSIRVIAPSWSLSIIDKDILKLAEQTLASFGLKTTYGEHVTECDMLRSSKIESRIEDIHNAFRDPSISGILTVIGV